MPADVAETAPEAARDPVDRLLIHWGVLDPGEDPFSAGALWAEGLSYSNLFGGILGPLFRDVTGLERWSSGRQEWELVT